MNLANSLKWTHLEQPRGNKPTRNHGFQWIIVDVAVENKKSVMFGGLHSSFLLRVPPLSFWSVAHDLSTDLRKVHALQLRGLWDSSYPNERIIKLVFSIFCNAATAKYHSPKCLQNTPLRGLCRPLSLWYRDQSRRQANLRLHSFLVYFFILTCFSHVYWRRHT